MTELERYGIEWTGPKTPIAVPMSDGYWTSYHLAHERIAELESREQHLLGVIFSVSKVSFEAGATHQGNDLHSDSVWFARKMHTKHIQGGAEGV